MMPVLNLIFLRALEILVVPYYYRDVIWSIAPLVFSLIMLQMYFGRYKTEPLGWNTAFGNTISLMWVTTILFRFISIEYGIPNAWNNPELYSYVVLAGILGIITLTLAVMNFKHSIPKKLAFVISSSLPINGLAYLSLVIIMGKIKTDIITLYSAAAIFICLWFIFYVYKKSITPAETVVSTLKKQEHKKRVEQGVVKRKITISLNNFKDRMKRFGRKLMFWKKRQSAEKEARVSK